MAVAVVATTAAAWWPARAISRVPTMSALSRRPARPLPIHRSLVLAGLLIVGGMIALRIAQPETGDIRPAAVIGGVLAVVLGAVIASPAAVRALGLPTSRLPFAPRLALRDLVRHQARAAAALAAITMAVGIGVSVVLVVGVNEPRLGQGNLPTDQILVRMSEDTHAVPGATLDPESLAQMDEAADAIATAIGTSDVTPLDVAQESLARLKALIDRFEHEKTPYASLLHPMFTGRRYGDYDHLARVREWSVSAEGDE
jgi:putative ABC transport system permease protein